MIAFVHADINPMIQLPRVACLMPLFTQSNRRSGKGRERKLLKAAEEGQSLLSEGLGSPSGSEAMSVAKDEEVI